MFRPVSPTQTSRYTLPPAALLSLRRLRFYQLRKLFYGRRIATLPVYNQRCAAPCNLLSTRVIGRFNAIFHRIAEIILFGVGDNSSTIRISNWELTTPCCQDAAPLSYRDARTIPRTGLEPVRYSTVTAYGRPLYIHIYGWATGVKKTYHMVQ